MAILGAPGTGKTWLTQALRLALEQRTTASSIHIADAPPLLAREHHRSYGLTLITGMDLPRVSAGPPTQEAQPREQIDRRLRQILDENAVRYTVVYGVGQDRTDCALQAIAHHSGQALVQSEPDNSAWQWNCEKCSDAACEHQMFTSLLTR